MNPPLNGYRDFLSQAKNLPLSLFFLGLFLLMFQATSLWAEQMTPVILDTDLSSDVDDAGAVAVLHALANQGKLHILATMVSSGDPWSGPCLDALNTSFGRPDIPIGIVKQDAVTHISRYTQYLAEHYPHDFPPTEQAPNALHIYRKVLAKQPAGSVTIISVGYFSNLSRLLKSGPDEYSPLDGKALVAEKVKELLCMAGEFPKGREWNIYQDAEAAIDVISRWPTPIVFCGFEIGNKIMTGQILQKTAPNHPVREAYQLYNNLTNRQSWDQATVLLADGTSSGKYLNFSETGYVRIDKKGNNAWEALPGGPHRFVTLNSTAKELGETIDALMLQATKPR